MISRERAEKVLSCSFPWGGKTKSRQALKGKPLLAVAFADPGFLLWTYYKSSQNPKWHWLSREIELLIELINTLPTVSKCTVCNNQTAKYLSLYSGLFTGDFLCCEEESCRNILQIKSNYKSIFVPLLLEKLILYCGKSDEKEVLKAFKKLKGLPKRFSFHRYKEKILESL